MIRGSDHDPTPCRDYAREGESSEYVEVYGDHEPPPLDVETTFSDPDVMRTMHGRSLCHAHAASHVSVSCARCTAEVVMSCMSCARCMSGLYGMHMLRVYKA